MSRGIFHYGGQAVIEGVMMRGPRRVAVAVRVGEKIVLKQENYRPWAEVYPVLGWPLLRGSVVLLESLILGVRALNYSAALFAGEEGEELGAVELGVTVVVALLMATALFILLPAWAGHLVSCWMGNLGQNAVEGSVRLGVFLLYLYFIRGFQDIQRVFQYHGAEHKVINTFEEGAELTVEEATKRSPLHPGCGTAFLLVVLVLSIFIFAFLGSGPWWWRFGSRLVLLPLVAGIAYEFIRLSRYQKERMKVLILPGLWLQKLTTEEPDASQLEVAITALQAVLPASDSSSAAGGE
ncbi:MAG TPA: DUF1385 domain-containing protein [Peptococcaceae bacterium]|nr:DUF1385 domain-containing protein [Peptococcaceae bacterium]